MSQQSLGTLARFIRRAARPAAVGVTDGRLLQRFAEEGDEAAFELLMWRHQRMVFSVCRRVLANRHDAEDAFQATFLALARKASSIRGHDSVGPWLHRVAMRAAVRLRGSELRKTQRETPDGESALPELRVGNGPEAQAAQRELHQLLHEEIDRLPRRIRLAVVTCYLGGKTCTEAAKALGLPRGTVATQLAKGRSLLRRRLGRRGVAVTGVTLAAVLTEAGERTFAGDLIPETIRATALMALGNSTSAGAPARVAALTQGVLRDMFFTQHRIVTALAACLTLTFFSGVLTLLPAAPVQNTGGAAKAGDTGADKKKSRATDKDKLQGTWVGVSFESDREQIPPPLISSFRMIFRGNKLVLEMGGEKKTEATFKLNSKSSPKEIDFTISDKEGMSGIYKLKGNRLTLCGAPMGKVRPSAFKAKDGATLIVFRRMEKNEKSNPAAKQMADLYNLIQKLKAESERSRAIAELNRARAEAIRQRFEQREKYVSGKLKKIDIAKNTLSMTLRDTTLKLPRIPISGSAKFRMDGKDCMINDYETGMSISVRLETQNNRTLIVEIKGQKDEKK